MCGFSGFADNALISVCRAALFRAVPVNASVALSRTQLNTLSPVLYLKYDREIPLVYMGFFYVHSSEDVLVRGIRRGFAM